MLLPHVRGALGVLLVAVLCAFPPISDAAETKIDLDGNAANGAESKIETNVLAAFPVEIENIIFSNARGGGFTFFWPGAGPGGFDSVLVGGPDVGTKWQWTTVSQVFTVLTPATFVPVRAVPTFGDPPDGVQSTQSGERVFMVPGKSIFPTQVTVSSASLTSSLVTFFSPEQTIATCESTFEPGRFEQTITNNTGEDVIFTVEQEDCCPESGMTICEDGCQFYQTDENNCGGCGITCSFDETCEQGTCESICPGAGQALCDDTCVNTLGDDFNCGGCGVNCAFDEFCDSGACTDICPGAGQELCGETCANTLDDVSNCGGCGVTCAFDEFCGSGACDPICPELGSEFCEGACANTLDDVNNCGACGVTCAFDEFCGGGACEPTCPGIGQELCGEVCVNTLGDDDNCGDCGIVCAFDEFCDAGVCADICPGQALCGETCVDLQNDDDNCGDCEIQCAFDEFCGSGACEDICPDLGSELCDGACADTVNDSDNCGACGVQCAFDEFCDQSVCADICPDLGSEFCNGMCADIFSDTDNCGACGVECAADEFCDVGACAPICPEPGQVFCNGVCVDGLNDFFNCGACGNECPFGEFCEQGTCAPICPGEGSSFCDGVCANLLQDPNNCGSCGIRCASEQICEMGRCIDDETVSSPNSPVEQSVRSRVGRGRPAVRRRLTPATLETDAMRVSRPSVLQRGATIEAPVCDFAPIQQVIPDGESFTQCQSGSLVGVEVFTTATVRSQGEIIGQGPCAIIVPAPPGTISDFLPSPLSIVVLDESGDGLLQPGERADVSFNVLNVGPSPFTNVVGTLSSDPDPFNPTTIEMLNGTVPFPDFPAFESPGDCETEAVLDPRSSMTPFSFRLSADQEPDVGRVFSIAFSGNTEVPFSVDMPIVIGIGDVCDPETDLDGETYDGLTGLLSPVNVKLLPKGSPVLFAPGSFHTGSNIPLKLKLACGRRTLRGSDIEKTPEIVRIVEQTAGEIPLININANSNSNPNDPFFECGASRCEFGLRTNHLAPGSYIISIEMPDTRVFRAGLRLDP